MIGRLAERFPFLQVTFFDASKPMIDFMKSDELQDVALISLDHDLEFVAGVDGDWVDPGTGLEVAKWLTEQPRPICPVVVHTTKSREAVKMVRLLKKSNWVSYRVIPHDDLSWIDTDWFRVVRDAIVDSAPKRRSTPNRRVQNKVSLIRALLAGEYASGQAFCREAIARIAEAYVGDLREVLEDVSVEVISVLNQHDLASILEVEGPIFRWCCEIGVPHGVFFEWAENGPLAPEQLQVGEEAAKRLSSSGIHQIQVRILEVAEMQALLAVSAGHSLARPNIQATISELKEAIELAVFIALRWLPPAEQPKLTKNTNQNRLP